MTRVTERLVAWFIPSEAVRGRTEAELARQFVFTHLGGPLIAQPMWIYLYMVSPRVNASLIVMIIGICSFWLLPFALRWTRSVQFCAFVSFQVLAAVSLFGAFHYGGFSSPFLPWLIVSLLLGLFYHSKNAEVVLSLFAGNVLVFLGFVGIYGVADHVPIEDLRVLGWLSIAAATLYMTWMALYYARVIGLRTELELEIERQRATATELEKARAVAEETSQARARFFSKMSHELRTPLNAIIGYSDILLEDCDGEGPEDAQRATDIGRINAAGRHLLSLVADVLDGKRIETDLMDISLKDVALGALCDEVVATAKPMVEKNANQFSVSCAPRGYVLRTDPKKLRQILLNLLSNAGKFTQQGTIRLELSVDRETQEDMLVATVSDTGIGIASDALPRLFTDYEQADASVFNRFGGTGIGLALSRKLSILLGGDITVSSRVGQGSRFSVILPARLDTGGEVVGRQALEPASAGEPDASPAFALAVT